MPRLSFDIQSCNMISTLTTGIYRQRDRVHVPFVPLLVVRDTANCAVTCLDNHP